MKKSISSVATLLSLVAVATAQVNKSNLTGIVHDSTGAVIPGIPVRIINQNTSVERTERTNEIGLYRFVLVDLGTYRIEIDSPGFKKFARPSVILNAGATTTVDVTLEVGDLSDVVTVQDEAPVLRTETGALGTTISERTIAELPLQGRNPYVFLSLSTGVQYNGDPSAQNPWDNS